jgi:hypothetical protein
MSKLHVWTQAAYRPLNPYHPVLWTSFEGLNMHKPVAAGGFDRAAAVAVPAGAHGQSLDNHCLCSWTIIAKALHQYIVPGSTRYYHTLPW